MTPRDGVERRVRPLRRILSTEEASLYQSASGALATAQRETERLHAEALESAAAVRDQAEALGRQRGEAEAARLLADTAVRALAMLDSLRGAIAEAIADGIAQVIGTIDTNIAVAAAAAHAVAQLKDRVRIIVRVAPAQLNAVRSALASYPEIGAVMEDASLDTDDCLIETASGFADAGLSTQLDILRDALTQCVHTRPGADKLP